MSQTRVVCGCALILLALCCIQQVRCLHLSNRLLSHNTDTRVAQSSTRQVDGDTEKFTRNRRFNRLHVCDTDSDCVGRNRPSCCAVLPLSSIRFCQPLSEMGDTCNTFSRPHMWSGERLGMHCPCEPGLECLSDSSSSYVSRGTCM
ncbi:uncharacterized protein LOC119732622 [Patiria miniata]|uniref:Prokineticin domain-containing protein n=1 Tax=Patiria miniata TaxID=46514 RepID=A0A914AEB2_PATMI|nr:uncharacterized protein LOC119732622 [Patiria miniata]